ncbi:MAG: MFS transporter [Sphingomonadales bacterium]|nr:MFS transporter [Sphingomonadales bacterium]
MTGPTEHADPPAEPDGLPTPRRYWAVLAIWLAIAMSVLDGAIANVALPTIAARLHAPPAVSVWIVNAYQLAITMLLLPLAALGDRIGYRRVYLPGLAVFTLGSGLCALSHSLVALVAARMLQGVGAAAVMSINAALVRSIYPAAMLGRGMGYNAVVLSISAATGPTVAGAILALGDWPMLFAVNLPIGLAALAIGARCLPHSNGHGRPPDYPAALLSALTLGLLVFGTETLAREGPRLGTAMVTVGAVLGYVLYRRERARPAPLVPLDLLRIPLFALSIATSITSFAAQMLAFVTLPFLLQGLLGRSVVASGLLMTPWPLAVGCTAPFAGRLADRYPAGLLGGIGLALFAAGLFALSTIRADFDTLAIAWRMALCGVGFGLFQSPNNRAMIASAPRGRSGAAGGMLATARLLGQTTGAVAVAAGFHWLGIAAGELLLRIAALAAALAAAISLLRLRLAQPPPLADALHGVSDG